MKKRPAHEDSDPKTSLSTFALYLGALFLAALTMTTVAGCSKEANTASDALAQEPAQTASATNPSASSLSIDEVALDTSKIESMPLRLGTYVEHGMSCNSANQADTLLWDGQGLQGLNGEDCSLEVIGADSPSYTVAQRCSKGSADSADSLTYQLILESPVAFRLDINNKMTDFRLCDPEELSAKNAAS